MTFASLGLRRRSRLGLAFSSRFLLAREDGNGAEVLRVELPEGSLEPATIVPNIAAVGEVARLAAAMVEELGGKGGTVSALLPDLALSATLLSSASRTVTSDLGGVLGPHLGYPASEARSDFWRGPKGEVLVAAVRKSVVRQYEQVIEAADCRLGWVDGASLVRVPAWAQLSEPERGLTVVGQLYRSHYVLAVFHAGELLDVRTRLRSPGDTQSVAEDMERLPRIYDTTSLASLRLSGESASSCAELLEGVGGLGQLTVAEDGEESQLAASLSALLQRS